MPAKELSRPCMDCKDVEATMTIRKRQLCSPCFKWFLSMKIVRRMEKYKPIKNSSDVRHQLLLPVSLGVSSSVLLHVLDTQIQRSLSKPLGKRGYDLHILVLETSTITASKTQCEKSFEAAKTAFPMHTYTRLPLHSIFEYVPEMKEIMREYAGPEFSDDSSQSDERRLAAFHAAISSATSKTDMESVLLTRFVIAFAKQAGCEAVLWGDSDSRLAAKTLAGAAKGRGASLTWQVSDGMSPWGIRFEFPQRDLSKSELQQFQSVCPELSDIVIPDPLFSDTVLTKNLSIDDLMMRYVQTQGEKYPGVMANVSRTANKLESYSAPERIPCLLCGGLVGNVKGNESGITVSIQPGDHQGSHFCYGCLRSRPSDIAN
ncbi:uncharacterized protein N7459_003157 [Penicillium hispanicum]|uniref:uncharacterized protein n=1 Tax=Penicillium hispanicum TaxID=1080232 RepID=UPI0025422C1A|nr:uncharacterized protein N7459_003157 [Penicillium hispanicum]KAJ5587392.1 hypothetical protein N7459_003157 [Penicillium hispanicum]